MQTLDPLFTDGHCLIETVYTLDIKHYNQKSEIPPSGKQFIWWEKNKNNFVQNIDMAHVDSIHVELDNAVRQPSVNEDFINHIASEISNLLQKSASQSFKKEPDVNIRNEKSDKPWYGFRCRNARLKYMRARIQNVIT